MKTYILERDIWLAQPIDVVFPFFADARNLELLTPPWLHFKILTPDLLEMRRGMRIDYQLRVHRVPIRWESEITAWDPPHRFVDEQRRGPYRMWIHEHTLTEKDGGTVARDYIRYAVPGGPIIHRLFVLPDLERIFNYRYAKLKEIFGVVPED
ncbi:MAG: CDP-paratose 2-epimerase [Candidatus Latescibacteria bacterium]|nr:CDP-paratose 2-epimerase [Candidatus Latescibacterota bacterium]NIO28417.1 CDP-paratose 2-epimerase [Candidatus Latescibacterota bacterium]NIO55966.1 CDP-paratose 2-epimerase [Candidatus Latescibacterota bacterium]NIT01930.1 CDP-paratose 2-epimerase [Candidatus Latescibacterota bacterium]